MKLLKQIGLAVFVLAVAQTASAGILLNLDPSIVYQQTNHDGCVIGNSSCDQPTAGSGSSKTTMYYDNENGTPSFNGGDYDLFSTVYLATTTGNMAINEIPLSFSIGIDVNVNTNPEYLVAFNTFYCTSGSVGTADTHVGSSGVGVAPSSTASPAGTCTGGVTADLANSWQLGPTQLLQHNGTGYSDALLTGFSLTSGNYYYFEAVVSSDSDGMEQFFVIPSGTPGVPEPTSILLLGTALAVVGRILKSRVAV